MVDYINLMCRCWRAKFISALNNNNSFTKERERGRRRKYLIMLEYYYANAKYFDKRVDVSMWCLISKLPVFLSVVRIYYHICTYIYVRASWTLLTVDVCTHRPFWHVNIFQFEFLCLRELFKFSLNRRKTVT